jgi:type IV conjugative transfer system coupling protein TraD
MSDFLTGGQVTAHKFRMFVQVVRIMARLSIVVIVLTCLFTFNRNLKQSDWDLVPAIIKAEIWQDLDPSRTITYKDYHGHERKDQARYFINGRYTKFVMNNFTLTVTKCIYRSIAVLVLALLGSILFFWQRGRSLKTNNQVRGSFLISDKELKRHIGKHNKQFKEIKPYELAGIPYAATGKGQNYTPGEQSHTLILGATGTGKTKIIQDLVSQCEARRQKAIIIDIKGDYIRHFYNKKRGDVILNPLDKRGANWSFFGEADALTGFDTIAKTLINDTSRDQFWANAARRIFSELAKLYWNENLSLSAFVDEILNKDISTLEKLLANTSAKHLVEQKSDRTVACVLMMLTVYLTPLKLYTKSNLDSNIFSITNWINDDRNNNFLFISTSAEAKESLNALIQMQVDIAINALCSSKKKSNNQIWFILDELPYFDKSLPNLKDGLTMSRSFGGAFVLGTQDMSSLSKIYGHELSSVIANNCRNKLIMNVDDSYTARWCSDILGEGEIEQWNEGLSYGAHEMRDGVSANKNKTLQRVVLPSEFSQLKTGQGYIKMPSFQPALINFKDCLFENKAKAFIEDTELKESFKVEIEKSQKRRKELLSLLEKKSDSSSDIKDLSEELEFAEKKILDQVEYFKEFITKQ